MRHARCNCPGAHDEEFMLRKVKLVDERAQLFSINPPMGGDPTGSHFDDETHSRSKYFTRFAAEIAEFAESSYKTVGVLGDPAIVNLRVFAFLRPICETETACIPQYRISNMSRVSPQLLARPALCSCSTSISKSRLNIRAKL